MAKIAERDIRALTTQKKIKHNKGNRLGLRTTSSPSFTSCPTLSGRSGIAFESGPSRLVTHFFPRLRGESFPESCRSLPLLRSSLGIPLRSLVSLAYETDRRTIQCAWKLQRHHSPTSLQNSRGHWRSATDAYGLDRGSGRAYERTSRENFAVPIAE
jgi:hypothetical protein